MYIVTVAGKRELHVKTFNFLIGMAGAHFCAQCDP